MRTRFPAPQGDDAFLVGVYSDTNLLSADPNNTVNQYPIASLYYGGASAANIAVTMASSPGAGVSVVFTNVQPGTTLPIAVRQIRSTGTTAAAGSIIAMVSKMGFQ